MKITTKTIPTSRLESVTIKLTPREAVLVKVLMGSHTHDSILKHLGRFVEEPTCHLTPEELRAPVTEEEISFLFDGFYLKLDNVLQDAWAK